MESLGVRRVVPGSGVVQQGSASGILERGVLLNTTIPLRLCLSTLIKLNDVTAHRLATDGQNSSRPRKFGCETEQTYHIVLFRNSLATITSRNPKSLLLHSPALSALFPVNNTSNQRMCLWNMRHREEGWHHQVRAGNHIFRRRSASGCPSCRESHWMMKWIELLDLVDWRCCSSSILVCFQGLSPTSKRRQR